MSLVPNGSHCNWARVGYETIRNMGNRRIACCSEVESCNGELPSDAMMASCATRPPATVDSIATKAVDRRWRAGAVAGDGGTEPSGRQCTAPWVACRTPQSNTPGLCSETAGGVSLYYIIINLTATFRRESLARRANRRGAS